MPDMTIEIGGRSFVVSCAEGEEGYLSAAAEMLDREAKSLGDEGKLTQDRMLLMAGLLLADKAMAADEELRSMDRRLASQAREIDALRADGASEPVEVVREVEVVRDAVPDAALARLDALATRAEALAHRGG